MQLILFGGYFFGKMWTNMEKRPFFRAAMAGLGKYHMGGYGRIGVYRVNSQTMVYFTESSVRLMPMQWLNALSLLPRNVQWTHYLMIQW